VSSTSSSAGSRPPSIGLGAAAIRDLADRHGVRPAKSLGQHFLIDPNLARAIAADARVGPGDRVLEVGAGLGSLTLALAATGARVRAMEFDRQLIPALEEVTEGLDDVDIVHADAMEVDWSALPGPDWTLCANLPYNIAVPLVLEVLDAAPRISRLVVMVQREVGERLVAEPGDEAYGAVSVRVTYRATATIVRRVPPTVFWPRPNVASVVVRLDRRATPPVDVDEGRLWRVVEAGFAERRKTMRNALRRLGMPSEAAEAALREAAVRPDVRAEALSLETFAALAGRIPT
jgi:16S rRNA (adenine1518-N6/adenine1519-N6)-dimethyltransferase